MKFLKLKHNLIEKQNLKDTQIQRLNLRKVIKSINCLIKYQGK